MISISDFLDAVTTFALQGRRPNLRQEECIKHPLSSGPMIVAGPGSAKTTVLRRGAEIWLARRKTHCPGEPTLRHPCPIRDLCEFRRVTKRVLLDQWLQFNDSRRETLSFVQ